MDFFVAAVWSTEAFENIVKRSVSMTPLNAETSEFVLRHAAPGM